MLFWGMLALLLLERVFELLLAARNRRRVFARGGREFYPGHYRLIVGMHLLFFLCLTVEAYPWQIPLDRMTWFALAIVLLLQGLRYWCIYSLGDSWNTRIILIPGGRVKRQGPYLFLRHPNYLAVVLEFVFIPLLARAPFTLLIFSMLNLLVLRRRVMQEERALLEYTDYAQQFPSRR